MEATTAEVVGDHVAVIGAGVLGLLATKNLKEQGLRVTALERNDFVGGTWHISTRTDQTCALPMTRANTSKQSCSFTDFPFPDDAPTHPSGKDLESYVEAYAKHFDLVRHIQFSTAVIKIERDQVARKWTVYTRSTKANDAGEDERQMFDRVVIATGMLNVPKMPDIEGIDKFAGEAVHSVRFKEPSKYEGKNVLVVGVGATGADTQSFLRKAGARSTYISHRSQYYLLPRVIKGKALDHSMSRRGMTILRALGGWWPRGCAALMEKLLVGSRRKAFPWLDKYPSFLPPRRIEGVEHRIPVFSDDLAINLRDGAVEAVLGIRAVTGPRSVALTDGRVLDDIDTIVLCSGYHYDFSLMRGEGDPTDPSKAPDGYRRIDAATHKDPHDTFPRLYRGFLSEPHPDSLAFLGHFIYAKPPFVLYDLVTMALASLWTGAAPLPGGDEVRRDIDAQYDLVVSTLARGPMPHMGLRAFGGEPYDWLNRVAGTGVTERLACWSADAWALWWRDQKFYNLLMDGVDAPAVYRLFDTGRGRKPWEGARARIEKANEEVRKLGESWERENSAKTK